MRLMMLRTGNGASELCGQRGDGPVYRLRDLYVRASQSGLALPAPYPTLDHLLAAPDPWTLARWIDQRLDTAEPLPEELEYSHDVPVRTGDLLCIGRNYVEHARELGNEVPGAPIVFMKPRASLIAHGETIPLPADSDRVDFEGELALVMGRNLVGEVSQDEARAAVFGVTLLNDVTDRALQNRLKEKGKPWFAAKGRRGFAPCGPALHVLTSPDELDGLDIETRVNGEVRQKGDASLWIFDAATLVRHLAATTGLRYGDIIATGTPAGVGPLQDGDVVELRSSLVGSLSNTVRREA